MTKSKPKKKTINIIRKEIILSVLPILEKQGFVMSPSKQGGFYYYPGIGHYYFLVRQRDENLEEIEVWLPLNCGQIQVSLNIFRLVPKLVSIDDLKNYDGCEKQMYYGPQSHIMKLDLEIFYPSSCFLFWWPSTKYWLKHCSTEKGKQRQIRKVTNLLAKDFGRIDEAVEVWHKRHKPIVVDWDGNKLAQP